MNVPWNFLVRPLSQLLPVAVRLQDQVAKKCPIHWKVDQWINDRMGLKDDVVLRIRSKRSTKLSCGMLCKIDTFK